VRGQRAPREPLARRRSIPPPRRRYLPPPIVALAPDPAFLSQRPTTPGTSLDHLKPRHLRHSRMISHTPMSSPPHPSHKAVLSAGILTKEHQPFSCVHGVDLEALRNFVLRHHHLQPSPNGICHENAIERVAFCQLWNISVEVAQLHSICNVTRKSPALRRAPELLLK